MSHKHKNKRCGYCDIDTVYTARPIYSTKFDKKFCDMGCFDLYVNSLKINNKKESINEIHA